jgi:uncharacterized protein YjiS (DUF1127 family)
MAQVRRPVGPLAAPGSAGRWMADAARHAWTRYWTRRAEHAAVAVLQGLDDRALKDFGLDRSEIESVVHGARPGERRVCWTPAQECDGTGCC